MEKKNTSALYNGLIWGLIIGFAGIIYNVILYMIDQNLNQALGLAGMIITIGLLVMGVRSFRDTVNDGVLPFNSAFGFCMVAIVVSSVIGIIYAYLEWTVIDPDIIGKMIDLQMEKMLDKGIPEEALEQAMNITSKFMKPGVMVAMGLIGSLAFGTITSLIISAIFKRDESTEDPVVEE